jgi:hypothetical protein
VWLAAAVALLVLGVAKQLQLQEHVTAAARGGFQWAGWYDRHADAQWVLALSALAGLLALGALQAAWLRGSPASSRTAAAALTALLALTAVRAASLHAIDAWVVREAAGVRLGWWIELGALAVIGSSAVAYVLAGKRSL